MCHLLPSDSTLQCDNLVNQHLSFLFLFVFLFCLIWMLCLSNEDFCPCVWSNYTKYSANFTSNNELQLTGISCEPTWHSFYLPPIWTLKLRKLKKKRPFLIIITLIGMKKPLCRRASSTWLDVLTSEDSREHIKVINGFNSFYYVWKFRLPPDSLHSLVLRLLLPHAHRHNFSQLSPWCTVFLLHTVVPNLTKPHHTLSN